MISLPNEDLISVYLEAKMLNLEPQFIAILKLELLLRGIVVGDDAVSFDK